MWQKKEQELAAKLPPPPPPEMIASLKVNLKRNLVGLAPFKRHGITHGDRLGWARTVAGGAYGCMRRWLSVGDRSHAKEAALH